MKELPDFATKKLESAYSLLNSDISQARAICDTLINKFPRHPWVRSLYGSVKFFDGYRAEGLDIVLKSADEAKDVQSYGAALQIAAKAFYPGIAYKYYKKLTTVEAYPDPKLSDLANTCLKSISNDKIFTDQENYLELSFAHDTLCLLTALSKFKEGLIKCGEIIARWPDFTPAYNNLSLCQFQLNNVNEALETVRFVLKSDGENLFARSTEAFFLRLLNQEVPILSKKSLDDRYQSKQLEYYTLVGEFEHVTKLYQEFIDSDRQIPKSELTKLLQAAALSFLRLGQVQKAYETWNEAVKIDPSESLTEKDSIFLFRSHELLPLKYIKSEQDEATLKELICSPGRVKTIVEFGDAATLELVLSQSSSFSDSALQEALIERTQILRNENKECSVALGLLSKLGIDSKVKQILKGDESREVDIKTLKITGTPRFLPSKKAMSCMVRGLEAMSAHRFKKAKEYFREGARLDPNCPAFPFNLANCSLALRENDIAEKILEEIYLKFPDYLFGKLTRVRRLLLENKVEEADLILDNAIDGLDEIHASEYSSYLSCSVRSAIMKDDLELAENYLDTWESLLEEFEEVPHSDFFTLKEMFEDRENALDIDDIIDSVV